MIIDTFNEFADALAVTGSAATDIVDLAAAGDALSKPCLLHIVWGTTADSAGATTVTFALQTSADEAFGSYDTLWTSSAVAKASLVPGYEVAKFPLPYGMKQYARIYMTVAVANLSAGTVDIYLTPDADTNEF